MLDAHLDHFQHNMGAYSEETGKRSEETGTKTFWISNAVHRSYQGQYNENIMGDYIWGLVRASDSFHACKACKTSHF